jgi:hypothetical protein
MKHRIVHLLQKYLFNPPVKVVFAIGLAAPGRRDPRNHRPQNGKAAPDAGGREWSCRQSVLDHFGTRPEIRLRPEYFCEFARAIETARRLAIPLPFRNGSFAFDDDPRARQKWLATQLSGNAANSAAVRFFGTQLLTVRIDLDNRVKESNPNARRGIRMSATEHTHKKGGRCEVQRAYSVQTSLSNRYPSKNCRP